MSVGEFYFILDIKINALMHWDALGFGPEFLSAFTDYCVVVCKW
jgi:hypothetical protein